jgi:hypothetical protein
MQPGKPRTIYRVPFLRHSAPPRVIKQPKRFAAGPAATTRAQQSMAVGATAELDKAKQE